METTVPQFSLRVCTPEERSRRQEYGGSSLAWNIYLAPICTVRLPGALVILSKGVTHDHPPPKSSLDAPPRSIFQNFDSRNRMNFPSRSAPGPDAPVSGVRIVIEEPPVHAHTARRSVVGPRVTTAIP